MKKTIIFAALAAIVFASCAKTDKTESIVEEPKFEAFISGEEPKNESNNDVQATTPIMFAEMVDNTYHWSVGDQIGVFITPANDMATKLVNNFVMDGEHSEVTTSTSFKGLLTETEIRKLDPNGSYDYYTYFPYHAEASTAVLPNITFNIPNNITLEKNVFPAQYAPMVGTAHKGLHPMTWLEEEEQCWGEKISFDYKHVMSFIELQLECNLMSQPVTRINISNISGVCLSGPMTINLETGATTLTNGTGGSNSLDIAIDGGFDVGDKIYIPMPVGDFRSHTYRITFYFANGSSYQKDISGGVFGAGKIHLLTFKLPFIVHFDTSPTLKEAGFTATNKVGISWAYKGWNNTLPEHSVYNDGRFAGNGNCEFGATFITFPGKGLFSATQESTATLTTPVLNTRTRLGRESIPVSLKIYMNGGGAIDKDNRKLYYGAVPVGFNTEMYGYPYVTIDGDMSGGGGINFGSINNNMGWTVDYESSESMNFDISAANPRVGLNCVTTSSYNMWIKKIEIYANY